MENNDGEKRFTLEDVLGKNNKGRLIIDVDFNESNWTTQLFSEGLSDSFTVEILLGTLIGRANDALEAHKDECTDPERCMYDEFCQELINMLAELKEKYGLTQQ